MFRLTLACMATLAVTTVVSAQKPQFGKTVQIEYLQQTPTMHTNSRTSLPVHGAIYRIEQGDILRVQVNPVRGADMKFYVEIQKLAPGGLWVLHEASSRSAAATIDMTITKPLSGNVARVLVFCADLGKANVRVSKVGEDDDDAATNDAEIRRLEEENTRLKKDLAEMKQQLADIQKLLNQKKP